MIWWWQFWCNDRCTPDSITKLDWEVKIRSIQEEDESKICTGSLIIWLWKYCWEIWHYQNANTDLIRRAISQFNWDVALSNTNVNEKFYIFSHTILNRHRNFISYGSIMCPADTDVFKTSSGRFKKVSKSYNQTRYRQEVWKKTSDLPHLEDVLFTSSWRRPICEVLKTSDLRRLEDVWFKMPWRRPIYVVLKTSNLRRLEDVQFTMSSRRLT